VSKIESGLKANNKLTEEKTIKKILIFLKKNKFLKIKKKELKEKNRIKIMNRTLKRMPVKFSK
jgi:hypothetical protein